MKFSSDSEWFAPVVMVVGCVVFFALVIGAIFWVRPPMHNLSRKQHPLYTFDNSLVNIAIGNTKFSVPKNHILSQTKNKMVLHALLPKFDGYRNDNWWMFEEKSINSKIVFIKIEHLPTMVSQKTRFRFLANRQLKKMLKSNIVGLTHYLYKKPHNRKGQDVFAGLGNNKQIIYYCFRPNGLAIAPNCNRTFAIALNTSLTYRFKRDHLKNWREIEYRIQEFIKQIHRLSFIDKRNAFVKKN